MEETTDVSKKSVAIKYGVINGLVGIILFVIIDFAGMAGNQAVSYLPALVTGVIIFFAQKEFIKEGDGFMNYGEGLGIGTLVSLFSSIISSVFLFVYVSFINTNYISNLLELQRKGMEEQGLTDAQIEQALSFTSGMFSPIALSIIGIFSGVIFGFIVSLIVSAFTKKARPEFE